MKDIFKNKYFIMLICATLVIIISAAMYDSEREKVPFIENTVSIIIKPFQSAITFSVNGVNSFFKKFSDVDKLQKENIELKSEINDLNEQLRKYQSFKQENDRLQALLELKQNSGEFLYVAANVISKDYGGWFESFTVNKGAKDGIGQYDAVVTSDGLVGCVTEVGESYAKVLSIIDSTSSVGAEISRTKEIAMVDGDINLMSHGQCKLSYSSKKASVISGDLLETSGLGDVYPKGLLIGKISKVDSEKGEYTIVEPAVDFEKISEVLIIIGEK